jgi:hypothetical protein
MNRGYYSDFELNDLISKKIQGSYLWMGIGLLITFGIMYSGLFSNNLLMFSLGFSRISFIVILGLVFSMSYGVNKMSSATLKILFLIYAAILGITLIPIMYAYSFFSILNIFLGTSAMFFGMTIYGMFTDSNLMNYTKYLFGAIIGILVMSLLNIFLRNDGINITISIIGLFVFMVYTAVDSQIIKNNMMILYREGQDDIIEKVQILGALNLYMDFINMFLYLLRLFGRSRD